MSCRGQAAAREQASRTRAATQPPPPSRRSFVLGHGEPSAGQRPAEMVKLFVPRSSPVFLRRARRVQPLYRAAIRKILDVLVVRGVIRQWSALPRTAPATFFQAALSPATVSPMDALAPIPALGGLRIVQVDAAISALSMGRPRLSLVGPSAAPREAAAADGPCGGRAAGRPGAHPKSPPLATPVRLALGAHDVLNCGPVERASVSFPRCCARAGPRMCAEGGAWLARVRGPHAGRSASKVERRGARRRAGTGAASAIWLWQQQPFVLGPFGP